MAHGSPNIMNNTHMINNDNDMNKNNHNNDNNYNNLKINATIRRIRLIIL